MAQLNKRPDTPLADSPTPDYRNIKTLKRGFLKNKPYTPTAKDSSEYRAGFERGVEGKNKFFPSSASNRGYQEAKERKLLPKQK
jgi:hypothetical protein